MRVMTETGLLYDDTDERCFCDIHVLQGSKLIGFVQCLDNTGNTRRYMGLYSHGSPEGSIHDIMHMGGKWPRLRA